ncbi:cysteine-rich outer membrane protein [Chlamydia abortus]|uniref:cysteine-rich outer membrane protein n=1 Tax=Chlamydia abortus TaxID=83555 RepID=UPI00029CBB0F|nr:cysteine-rich outer membrane protein [Chlamydia abortus]EGK68962.1 putative sulfur-rich membrane protein [Chlamydia abortus LLG]QEM73565.1 cysteine-rich outer membrane protein [Chlamydia abortus]SFV97619.1 sulfur-rich membrane protein [Chlamydia abortus]
MAGESTNSVGNDITSLIQPGLDQVIQDEGVQVTLINSILGWCRIHIINPVKSSKIVKSRAFQITMIVLGIILLIAGLALTFVLQGQLGKNAFLFLIPAVIGLVKLLATSVFMEKPCTPEKWRLCKRLLATTEDILDDGQINQSNTIFTMDSSESTNAAAS